MFINKLWQKIIFAKIGKFTPIQEQVPPLRQNLFQIYSKTHQIDLLF